MKVYMRHKIMKIKTLMIAALLAGNLGICCATSANAGMGSFLKKAAKVMGKVAIAPFTVLASGAYCGSYPYQSVYPAYNPFYSTGYLPPPYSGPTSDPIRCEEIYASGLNASLSNNRF